MLINKKSWYITSQFWKNIEAIKKFFRFQFVKRFNGTHSISEKSDLKEENKLEKKEKDRSFRMQCVENDENQLAETPSIFFVGPIRE